MVGFKTKTSTYYINQYTKEIWGGYFGDNKTPYVHLQAMQGTKARVKLHNGDVVETGIVREYI